VLLFLRVSSVWIMPFGQRRSPERDRIPFDRKLEPDRCQSRGSGTLSGRGAQPDRIVDEVHQALALQWLGKVGNGSIGEALLPECRVVMRGHDDDRKPDLLLGELPLHIAAGEAWHPVIEDGAVWYSGAQ